MRLIHWCLAGAIVSLTVSCSGQTDPSSQANPSDSSTLSDNVQSTETVQSRDDLDEVQLEGAIAEPSVEEPPSDVPPLFAPTSPDQRASQVSAGRPDPFSSLVTTPTIVPARAVTPQPQSQQPLPPQPSIQPLQPIPLSSLPSLPPPPVATVPIPVQPQTPAPLPNQTPVPVASPQPVPAAVPAIQTVEVTGVVNVGGMARAIVTVPNEGGGRSVGVGDRIANGQVLVKRIDIQPGGDPIVVLEQNGVEVTRFVSLSGS